MTGLAIAPSRPGFIKKGPQASRYQHGLVGRPQPSLAEYLHQEAEAIVVLWPKLDFRQEEGEGLAKLAFTRGCLGAGWGRPWALAGRLGLGKEQVCHYCREAFRIWGGNWSWLFSFVQRKAVPAL